VQLRASKAARLGGINQRGSSLAAALLAAGAAGADGISENFVCCLLEGVGVHLDSPVGVPLLCAIVSGNASHLYIVSLRHQPANLALQPTRYAGA
jgi:hypothetical protein